MIVDVSTHADRQGVDISVAVFYVCVCSYGYEFLCRG